ncbi:MAG: cyclic beta 1-2 glucan synthetase [Desulfomicrobium sp.]|nr:cyclic beta 1-2 glucan synthetase [Pseudomonadota bacterium]MBV1711427.1 cyclic beta 1-2 glucan synthetase [Desulfomicrobium sp.]MBU4570829.1 cyclic beta 1-2 glucan synthetase [Pseudomonadota bacterium]MBU4595319.1 cyclic beta 1-2 glucan synthetase [Pseudomonadota bacterium]MBV1720751.1 cyclic beta 1-2 glucan synthetase [Desulfomicrobium sp.]
MKTTSDIGKSSFLNRWKRLAGRGPSEKSIDAEHPLRAELFSASQMEQHGKILASMHQLTGRRTQNRLLSRLAENEHVLRGVHRLLTEDVKQDQRMTPAGEWLLDNFYVIEEQIRTAAKHFPKGYSRELPQLHGGHSSGLPRVYDLALEAISHGDGRVDPEYLSRFVAAYQTITPLKLGELWAIPIMLRLALIENLRRVAARLLVRRKDRNRADYWANLMTEVATTDPKSLILTIADMARSDPPMASSFVAELTRRLQGQGPAQSLPLSWIERRLSESGQTIDQLVRLENQQQASDQISISNSIGSLRSLTATNWNDFVESLSAVEGILGQDPISIYSKMNFSTRDRYRHVVETIAKKSPHSEPEVARRALELAREGAAGQDEERKAHVGFYLVGDGLAQLERLVEVRRSPAAALCALGRRFFCYGGGIVLLTAILTALLAAKAHGDGLSGWHLGFFCLLLVLCSGHLSVSLANWMATLLATPHLLPRMDFSKGIPPEARTLVVVPTMLTCTRGIEELINDLEVRFLGNRDQHLHFALLTDLADAAQQVLPEDEELVSLASGMIEVLNAKYPGDAGSTFFLLHRPRSYNTAERKWMGFERKRGKLGDLNALLSGGTADAADRFALIVGDTSILPDIRFVITLDTDTQLPRDSARQFVGALCHPLNRARYDTARGRVVDGYGILQPRVAVSLPGANRSRYARMCASEVGIDPYTSAVSDVYQDLFGEGSFIGKGIYDVEVFRQALDGRFPDNRILSHDLLEGCYARAGLLSDVELYEQYPTRYSEDVARRHRWIRGDWQIARWLMPRVPGAEGRLRKNPISMLSQWKILDNLRRSLSAAALTLLLLLSWTVLPDALFWTTVVLGIILVPCLVDSLSNVFKKPDDVSLWQHLAASTVLARQHFGRALFTLACLPYEAFFSLDAILRTIWRMLISHRGLLEWNPSNCAQNVHVGFGSSLKAMWIGPLLAISVAAGLAVSTPQMLPVAGPLLALWFLSPAIVWWISRAIPPRQDALTRDQTLFLRRTARKTWAFFETFVGPEDQWLPPDNFQEHPFPVVAHRTSPTNMGLALLANLAALDFGIISTGKFLDRTMKTLRTMGTLERYRGHFFNWYDTLTLVPLPPRYISSVDSGNLAGHLLTLKPGLLELADRKILEPRTFESLRDTLEILAEALKSFPKAAVDPLAALGLDLTAAPRSEPMTLIASRQRLERLAASAAVLIDRLSASGVDPDSDAFWWAGTFAQQCRDALTELSSLAPWAELAIVRKNLADLPTLDQVPTLNELTSLAATILPDIVRRQETASSSDYNAWGELQSRVTKAGQHAEARIKTCERLALQCNGLAQMEFGFLCDETSHLLAIGYNAFECRRDNSFYDLLASEARLAAFVAIAQGQLPQQSWFALSRLLTTAGGEPVLLSWSGSMFEYLMPMLVMPTFESTLLDQTSNASVARQIEYGKKRSVPWGISECGYNAIDVHHNYQYRAFGVPGLGLKRGLAEDLVIAPYATALALMVAPGEACRNLLRLESEGFGTRYGFYEAIDYTPSRLPRGQSSAVVRSFMAHHQGMSLLSMAYLLLDRPMQKRFASDPQFQATMLLLQERIPKTTAFFAHTSELSEHQMESNNEGSHIRVFSRPDTPDPEVQLLSNGRYHVMVTNAGGGYSRWNDLSVTRWREDRTRDNWGTFCFLRDLDTREYWSTAYQPTRKQAQRYEAIFSEGRAEFRVQNHNYDTHTEITVSPEDDIELRRVRITNRARTRRALDLTSYAEVILASAASDDLHPAFSNLFVQTEIIPEQQAILCTRRPRSRGEKPPWMLHMMIVHDVRPVDISFETDRMQFIGRENTVADPLAMCCKGEYFSGALSGSEGSVLDPIVSIRCRIFLEPEESVTLNIISGIGETREEVLQLVEKYQDRRIADRVFDLAWTHGQVLLRQLNASEADAQLYARLAGSIIYANAALRAEPGILMKNRRGQSGLWSHAISGDLPIVLLQIQDIVNIDLVRQLVQAHAYWRLKGLKVDLVIWNEDQTGYRQLLYDQIMGLVAAGVESGGTEQPGGIFVRSGNRFAEEDRILIQTVARVVISDTLGTLAQQIDGRTLTRIRIPQLVPSRTHRSEPLPSAPQPRHDLTFFNGQGGFTPDGREYVITTAHDMATPAPWINVLANPLFGSVISESGSSCTWSENAHEFRLTPWDNDPVTNEGGEAFYLRDEERGHYWSPTPRPCRGAEPYVSRHGFGYSVFEHTERGIRSELMVYVALDAPIKFSVLKVSNVSERSRRISATGYVEWVLGDLRPKSAFHVITEIDQHSGAIFASNAYNPEFGSRTAFFDVDDVSRTITADRTEFLGRNGSLRAPVAMTRTRLSGKTGTAMDPCAAIQVDFELEVGEEREIIFKLGVGTDTADAQKIIHRFRGAPAARHALDNVWQHWTHTLGAIHVETPDQALNVLANGWLLYQTLACRLWARCATYQSGGAFGFRDQLQDVMALIHARPGLVREHLLLCASRQFEEGDVQHWWHPPVGRGVRTKCSDDYLWLPLATCRYVTAIGDTGVLDESAPFLRMRALNADEESCYDLPEHSDQSASLYEHCVRAIRHGLRFGIHGLPLIGSGDWNDGMNLVGEHGKGESVWLGFFLHHVLEAFAPLAHSRGDVTFSEECLQEAAKLSRIIEESGWDGNWYRRAYFDDGTPLGSAKNDECRIDSIAQSWSVLSGAGDPHRAHTAMQSLDRHLVRREHGLVQLLDPPFDTSELNPGYIKGYVPGVRENGGQYTHAAIWAAMAFARLGDSKRAWEIFDMINPVNHGRTSEETAIYKGEPYVVAADVYGAPPHTGRGGWTWYTGSAAWMYRLIVESLLGLSLEVDRLRITPCPHPQWKEFTVHYRFLETVYHITVTQFKGKKNSTSLTLDNVAQTGQTIALVNDHQEHWIKVRIDVKSV